MISSLLRTGVGLLFMAATAVRAEVVLAVPGPGTLRVAEAGGQTTVRLAGLTVPYRDVNSAQSARRALAALVLGKDVRLHRIGRSYQGEVLARVSLNGRDIGAALVAQGYARVSTGAAPGLLRLQREARRDARGLWAATGGTASRSRSGSRSYGLIKVIIN